MIHIVQIILTGIMQGLVLLFWYLYDGKRKITKGGLLVWGMSLGLTLLLVTVFLLKGTDIAEFSKKILIYQILYCIAVADAYKRVIPNPLLLYGTCVYCLYSVFGVFLGKKAFKNELLYSLGGFCFGLFLLGVVYLLSRGAMGFGDVKLFGYLGFCFGISQTFTILFAALLFAALYGGAMLLSKKKKKRDCIPFGPFVLIGYVVTQFL